LNTLSAVRGLLLMLGESEITHPWWTYAGELCSQGGKNREARGYWIGDRTAVSTPLKLSFPTSWWANNTGRSIALAGERTCTLVWLHPPRSWMNP